MNCPRCHGLVDDILIRTEEGVVYNCHCLNCGWYPMGVARDAYGPVRPMVAKGFPEPDEFILRRNGVLRLRAQPVSVTV